MGPILFCSLLVSACEKPEQREYRAHDGKNSPYQNVTRVFLVPEIQYDGCSVEHSEVPEYLKPDKILPVLTQRAYIPSAFNHLKDGGYKSLPRDEIVLGAAPKRLLETDLQVTFKIGYHCGSVEPYLSLRWETLRNPSIGAFVRKSEDQWYGLDHPFDSAKILFGAPKERNIKVISTNRFQRFGIDGCGLREANEIPKTNTSIVQCQ